MIRDDSYPIYLVEHSRFYPEIKVSYKEGSKTIAVLNNDCNVLPISSLRITHEAFPVGAYVTHATKSELHISAPANETGQEDYLFKQKTQKESEVPK